MSKRTRHADNSKRQQPIQQQRAQARLTGNGGPAKADAGRSGTRQSPSQDGPANRSRA